MVTLTIALRYLLRRKVRMGIIGFLVFIGTIIIIFGETFSLSAKHFSKESIINYFTGDCIIYSERSKEKPSPFSFTTPLPVVANPQKIEQWLHNNPLVDCHVAIAQNYGLLSVQKNGTKTEVPFIFYAVDPRNYSKTFKNITMQKGSFYTNKDGQPVAGVVLSSFQRATYSKNYNIDFEPGDTVTLLSLTEGGSVNAYPSKIIGIYEPNYYKNVFNYINFLDIQSYSRLYNFTGVDAASLPKGLNTALAASSDDDIFGLAQGTDITSVNTQELVPQDLTGYTMIAVKLKKHSSITAFSKELSQQGFGVHIALWNEASGFFANVATIIQSVLYGATFLIFLIVIFILMNTLIISVLERTGEIGTLRAMGGEKSFITAIFLWESLLLNGTAFIAGAIMSIILIAGLSFGNGFPLPDIIAQYLVGGGGLQLLLSPRPFVEALACVVIVSALATLYPISVATAITPLKAMSDR